MAPANLVNHVAIFVAIFLPIAISAAFFLLLGGKHWREAQDRARARRITDAKLNARLLRLNL